MRLTNPSLKTDNVIFAHVNTLGAQLIKFAQAMRSTDETGTYGITPNTGGAVFNGDGTGKNMAGAL